MEKFIERITGENGVFEIGVFFILLMISTFAMMTSFNNQSDKIFTRARRHFISFIAICFYFLAMQEIRWGQLLTSKQNAEQAGNLKGVVDLSGFLNVELINTVVHWAILLAFIALPLVIYYRPGLFRQNPSIKGKTAIYAPSLHNILMFSFACSLQTLVNPVTRFDFIIWLLIFLGITWLIVFRKQLRSAATIFHLCLLGTCWILLAINFQKIPITQHHFYLWKLVGAYAIFYWLYNWTVSLKEQVDRKMSD
ncbi:hypothetical protein QQ020_12265 [Fulvivirgaceae bacterium BMA12]|uniref:DUF998 domain-containing protein n=1 Tax=Agaribacillus aureus TaxID=3051825 RepID=A0ABT8L4Z7_9BACT|nr:hypothetical protein [Fulvivirgaceae bacterium BMA12]